MLLLARIFLNAIALLIVARLVPGVVISSLPVAFIAAIILGLINALIGPILQLLSLPVTILTLGLFSLVVNAILFWLAASLSPGFEVANFSAAFWGALIFSIISWIVNSLVGDRLEAGMKK